MQFKVPQDVQRADHIVGPLTLRQLIICGIGFSFAYALYTVIGRDYEIITALIPVIIIGLITVIFAFIKPLNLNFEKYILYKIASIILPSKRYWLKGMGDPSRMNYTATMTADKNKIVSNPELNLKKKQTITELTKILDQKYQ